MTRNFQFRRRVDALSVGDESGFSLIELMATMILLVTMAAFILPFTRTTLQAMNLSSDARNLSSATALAKMRAAAEFSKARIRVDFASKTFWVERWQKTAPIGWVTEGVMTTLSSNVNFGFTGVTTPPPNTQAAIAQATGCLDNAGVAIAGTGCIVFNSRGVPVDGANVPTPNGAFYVIADSTVFGITAGAGGLIQLWQNNTVSNVWALK
jgi:prepilin-type N-terminal cleavage/methylation domain-containing protein